MEDARFDDTNTLAMSREDHVFIRTILDIFINFYEFLKEKMCRHLL